MIRKVAKNTLFLSASQITARLIGFLYFVFLARTLGVNGFGVYTFTISFIYNFIPVADFGLERFVLRDISRWPDKSEFYLSRLLPLRIVLAIGAYLLAILLGIVLKQSSIQILYFTVFGLALLPYNLIYLFSSFLNAKEKMHYMAGANISLILLTAILGVSFVFLKWNLLMILFAYPLANVLLALVFIINSKKWGIPLEIKIDFSFWIKALKQSWIFATLTIMAVFYLRLSILMVNFLRGTEATGLYSSAFKFIEAMILIPQSVALALFPHFSRLTLDSRRVKEIVSPYLKGIGFLFLFSLPFVFVLMVFPKIIVNIAYGSQYLLAVPVFKILGLSLILFFINALAANIIHNSKEVKLFLPLLLSNFLIKLLFCLLLIPRWSIIGAAWAVVFGEAFGLIINNLFIFYILKKKKCLAQ